MAEYIERAAIMEFPIRKDHCDKERANEHFIFGIESVLEYVQNLPAADVAPVVHGRWISWEEADNPIPSPHWHECSVCHDAAQVLVNDIELLSGYCPNCGARMDGDDDGKAD